MIISSLTVFTIFKFRLRVVPFPFYKFLFFIFEKGWLLIDLLPFVRIRLISWNLQLIQWQGRVIFLVFTQLFINKWALVVRVLFFFNWFLIFLTFIQGIITFKLKFPFAQFSARLTASKSVLLFFFWNILFWFGCLGRFFNWWLWDLVLGKSLFLFFYLLKIIWFSLTIHSSNWFTYFYLIFVIFFF